MKRIYSVLVENRSGVLCKVAGLFSRRCFNIDSLAVGETDDPAVSCMAIAWGDAWTNLLQPFWALPALGIAGLGARDIMGFCVVDLILSGIIVCVMFVVVGLI